jgi:hypothetical protein
MAVDPKSKARRNVQRANRGIIVTPAAGDCVGTPVYAVQGGKERRKFNRRRPNGVFDQDSRPDIAARLRADTLAAIERAGFGENFDPVTGEGGGGSSFSWTAAAYLDVGVQREGDDPETATGKSRFAGKAARNCATGWTIRASPGRRPTQTPIGTQITLATAISTSTRTSVAVPDGGIGEGAGNRLCTA